MTVIWCDSGGTREQTGPAAVISGLGASEMMMLQARGECLHLPRCSLGPKGFFLVALALEVFWLSSSAYL